MQKIKSKILRIFSANIRVFRIIVFFLLFLWCAGFSINALFPGSRIIVFYPLLKQAYAGVCHQIPYKTFEVNNLHFLVCARCTGIYTGAILSLLPLLLIAKHLKLRLLYLYISGMPMLADVILYKAGIYSYSKLIALATGILFGSTAIVYILAAVENFLFKELTETNEFK